MDEEKDNLLVLHRTQNSIIDMSLIESNKVAKERFIMRTKMGWNSNQLRAYKPMGNPNEVDQEILNYFGKADNKDNEIKDYFEPLPKKVEIPQEFYDHNNNKYRITSKKNPDQMNKLNFRMNNKDLLYTPSLKKLINKNVAGNELKKELLQSLYRVNAAKRGHNTHYIMAPYNVSYFSPNKQDYADKSSWLDNFKINKTMTYSKRKMIQRKHQVNMHNKHSSYYESPQTIYNETYTNNIHIPHINSVTSMSSDPLIKLCSLKDLNEGIKKNLFSSNKSKFKSPEEALKQMVKEKKVILPDTLKTKLNAIEQKINQSRKRILKSGEGTWNGNNKVRNEQNKESSDAKALTHERSKVDFPQSIRLFNIIQPSILRILNEKPDENSNTIYTTINKCKTFYKQKMDKQLELLQNLKALERIRPISTDIKKAILKETCNPNSKSRTSESLSMNKKNK